MDITFNVGGEAGQGIDTIGDLLTQVFVKAGFFTFTIKDYESRIRGGYNFSQIRVSDKPIYAPSNTVDVIVALSRDAIIGQRENLVENGVIVFEESIEFDGLETCHFPAPLTKTAQSVGGSIRMTNAAAMGAVLSIIQFPFILAENALTEIFSRKGEAIVSGNIAVAKALYEYTTEKFTGICRQNLSGVERGPCKDCLILNGNQALAFGAMAGNAKWVSSYPMSPSTSLFQEIVTHGTTLNIGTLQSEDEIAGLAMAIGASFAGARALTTTSGGGFSLMVEGLGFAAMTETPVVIYNAQRPGPSTGLPTRTEQSDLLFMLHASQGEFPRIMLAPKNPSEAFEVGHRAFNLADRFQVPVLILGDQHFADSVMNIPDFNFAGVSIDRGKLADENVESYKRYELTEDGISPRAYPGDKGKVVASSGNTHREDGHITEDPNNRNLMVEKFYHKVPHILRALNPPEIYGPKRADYTVLSWGSTWGAVYEAISVLNREEVSVNQLHYCDVYPLRRELLHQVFEESKEVISIEQNATSQFAKLVSMETGLTVSHRINRYNGRPMTAKWIITQLEKEGLI
jgi:2-oxoglutarate ferredoxin oxidoreductase subunit alpha